MQLVGGGPIDDLILKASVDRFALSTYFLETSEKLRRMRPPSHRNSVSRAYYAMYHAARTIGFVTFLGDDNQDHKDIHKCIPDDFANAEQWKNDLKEARLRRNEADYEPYPKLDSELSELSMQQLSSASNFLAETRQYLIARGCTL